MAVYQKWICDDGTSYDDEDDAREHDEALSAHAELRAKAIAFMAATHPDTPEGTRGYTRVMNIIMAFCEWESPVPDGFVEERDEEDEAA